MEFGCTLSGSGTEDYGVLREAAQAFDEAGFGFVTTNGHVLTAEPGRYSDRPVPAYGAPFRDPFVLFSHVAAITKRLRFRTAILILPLFPTALVAKHAAELSLASGGRFELGVGISWQLAEYEALGQDVHTRGQRLEEQLEVLRLLWTEPYVTYEGRFHKFDALGLGQLPDDPIPILIGCGDEDQLLRRVVRLADGWVPVGGLSSPDPAKRLRELAVEEGSDRAVRVTGRVVVTADNDELIDQAQEQVSRGADAITLGTAPDIPADQRVQALIDARAALALEFKSA